MDNGAVRKVKDLAADAREWLNQLLGRPLQEEEEVAVLVRGASAGPLARVPDRLAEQAEDVPEREHSALIDEAFAHVRRRDR